jgi:hypothetical protein
MSADLRDAQRKAEIGRQLLAGGLAALAFAALLRDDNGRRGRGMLMRRRAVHVADRFRGVTAARSGYDESAEANPDLRPRLHAHHPH